MNGFSRRWLPLLGLLLSGCAGAASSSPEPSSSSEPVSTSAPFFAAVMYDEGGDVAIGTSDAAVYAVATEAGVVSTGQTAAQFEALMF